MPTHNINDVEKNILNVIFAHPEKNGFIFENVLPEFFSDGLNAKIFIECFKLFSNGDEIDNVIVYEKINTKVCGERLVDILTNTFPLSPFTKKYCELLFKKYLERLIKSATSQEDFQKIEDLKNNYAFKEHPIKHISEGAENFEKNYEKMGETVIATGYPELDDHIGSFMGGDYIALGGSTGCGKTAVALNISRQVCMQGRNVLYCSLEMPIEQLQNRFICLNKRLNAMKYRSIGFTEQEKRIYKQGVEELQQWNLSVVTDYNLTVEKLRLYAIEHMKQGLGLIVIDHLGLMSGYGNKSLYEKSTTISRKLKCLATELNVPIMVLVQLNRDLKNRQNKKPILSDIRESGAIEQDADFVIFTHRGYLHDNTAYSPNDLSLIIAKNRHGTNNIEAKLNYDVTTQYIFSNTFYNALGGKKYDF